MISTHGKEFINIWSILFILGVSIAGAFWAFVISNKEYPIGVVSPENQMKFIDGVNQISDTIEIEKKLNGKPSKRTLDILNGTKVSIIDESKSSKYCRIKFETDSYYTKKKREMNLWVLKRQIEKKDVP